MTLCHDVPYTVRFSRKRLLCSSKPLLHTKVEMSSPLEDSIQMEATQNQKPFGLHVFHDVPPLED